MKQKVFPTNGCNYPVNPAAPEGRLAPSGPQVRARTHISCMHARTGPSALQPSHADIAPHPPPRMEHRLGLGTVLIVAPESQSMSGTFQWQPASGTGTMNWLHWLPAAHSLSRVMTGQQLLRPDWSTVTRPQRHSAAVLLSPKA